MLKFKEITSAGKNTKIGGNPEAELFSANSPLQNKYSIIDSISLSYNLMKHYVSPFFRKEIIIFKKKNLIMLQVKKTCQNLLSKFHILYFYC